MRPFPLKITVLGSGTSVGIPTIGCHCDVCTSTDPRDNRLRPSVLVSYEGRNVLIDTTPDFRTQALRARIDLFGMEFQPVPILHGSQMIYGFRFGGAAYLTDHSDIPETSLAMLGG